MQFQGICGIITSRIKYRPQGLAVKTAWESRRSPVPFFIIQIYKYGDVRKMSNKKNDQAYEAMKQQFAEVAERKLEMVNRFAAEFASIDAEIAKLQRQMSEGVSALGFDEYQNLSKELEAAFTKRELLEKQKKAFEQTPCVSAADYQALKKSISDECKAVTVAAEAELFELMQPLAKAAKKYTTILNELATLQYVYVGGVGKDHADNVWGFGLGRYFPNLLNDLNSILSGSYNEYAKANDKEGTDLYDHDELTSERKWFLALGSKIGFAGLPDTRVHERK